MTTDPEQQAMRKRAHLVFSAQRGRWTGTIISLAGVVFVLIGEGTLGAGIGVIITGGALLLVSQLILSVIRHRHPDDDPAELAQALNTPAPPRTAPRDAQPRRRWHDVSIPPGPRYIDKGHANDLAAQRLLRRAWVLTLTVTAVVCGIVGLFVFDGLAYPVTLIVIGVIGSVVAGGFLLRFLLELSAEKDRDWPHL